MTCPYRSTCFSSYLQFSAMRPSYTLYRWYEYGRNIFRCAILLLILKIQTALQNFVNTLQQGAKIMILENGTLEMSGRRKNIQTDDSLYQLQELFSFGLIMSIQPSFKFLPQLHTAAASSPLGRPQVLPKESLISLFPTHTQETNPSLLYKLN